MSKHNNMYSRSEKAKKEAIIISIIILIIVAISFAAISFYNLRDADQQNNKIVRDLSGNTYNNLPYERGGAYFRVWSDYAFDTSNQTVDVEANGKTYSLDYYPRISPFGSKYIVITSDTGYTKEFRVFYAGDIIAQICPSVEDADYYYRAGFGRIKNVTVSEKRENNQSISFQIWLAITVTGCSAIIILLFKYVLICHSENKEVKRLAQEIGKKTEQKNRDTVKEQWDRFAHNIGYKNNSGVGINGKIIWINRDSIYYFEDYRSYSDRCVNSLAGGDWSQLPSEVAEFEIERTVIPVAQVQYFSKEGDIKYTTKVSGGGGGGSSISGAIIGGLIAGEAGAIIGSRKGIQEIKSTTETHDDRKTVLRYYVDGAINTIFFDGFEIYDYLLSVIPNKDLLTIQLQYSKKDSNSTSVSHDVEDIQVKLQSLKTLYESGLLTEEEYKEKRNKLINLI